MTDWPVKTLGEVCDFVRGVTYDKADARSDMKSGFIPLLRATNITEKGLLRDDFVFVPNNGVRADQKFVGRSVLVEDPGEMTFGAFCGVLRPSPEILPRYLSHFMSSRSVRTAWSEAAQGTNINNLKRDDILQTECLLPPLEEQKRIVALLDAATACVTELTACYEQARAHANDLFTSALRELMEEIDGTVEATLSDLCQVDWGNTNLTKKSYVVGGDYLAVSAAGPDGRIGHAEHKAFTPVLSAIGARCGRMFLPEEDFTAIKNTITLTPKLDVASGKFIYFLFEHLSLPIRGAAQPFIAKGDIEKFEVAIPSLSRQEKIVEQLEMGQAKTSQMVAAYDAKLRSAKDLRQSILEAAFAGEL
jgi:restriction endonuclease S subunit